MGDGGDEDAGEPQTIIDGSGLGLIGESGPEESTVQPVAAPIPGEDSPGPIRAVSRGREADDEPLGVGIAEVRHGFAPVGLLLVGLTLLGRHTLAPRDQTRAQAAVD